MALPPSDDDRFYKGSTLTKAFAISSLLMLLFTVWMILDDFGQEWKGYQRKFFGIKREKFEKDIEAAKGSLDQAKIDELKKNLSAMVEQLDQREKDRERLEKEKVTAETKEKIAIGKYQDEKAFWDVEKYEYEAVYGHEDAHTIGHEAAGAGHAAPAAPSPEAAHAEPATTESAPTVSLPSASNPKAQKAHQKLLAHWTKVMELRDKAAALTQVREAKEAEYANFFAGKKKLEGELKVARGNLDILEGAKKASELTIDKMVRSAPILDMANPTFRLQQIVLPTIRDDIYFAQVQKVDRCTTCHQAIDLPGFEDQPNPFKTHPKLDLMLGSRSPHPIDKIGCTVCHDGRGMASHFTRSAHTPRDHAQKKVWEREYHWHEMHHVIEKMIPLQYTEGKCRVCHRGTEYVPRAEKLNASVQLIKASGCYGCHRIEGWDHLRKPAPSLKKIKGKVTRDWMVKWVRDPRGFNEHARMPAAFFQSNITSDEYKSYNEAEVQGIADFLMSVSDDYRPNVSLPLGNAARGKELFSTVGCLGCHQIDDVARTRGRFGFAPDLSTVGSKVSREWLTSWLKNPNHYWEETTMPSLRLSDSEVSDLAAYLMAKKNTKFEGLTAGQADTEVQKKVMRLYLLRDPLMAPATEEKVHAAITKMSPQELSIRLGKNAVGRYGCFGCHEIKGYENTQGIGTELTEWGSKPINKLDFGLLATERTNYDWANQKLTDTRSFDTGIVKEYLDLLRMPQFGFHKEERDTLITGLLGMTSQKIAIAQASDTTLGRKVLNPRETAIEEGSRVIHKYNCQGCHVVEMLHQPLPESHPGYDEHEKKKFALEGRVLAHFGDDESLGPPPLVTQGARVQTEWVSSFLKDPSNKLRRILKIRMPSFHFGNGELNKIVGGWASAGNLAMPIPERQGSPLTPQNAALGASLFGKLQCNNCHTRGEGLTAADMDGGSKGVAPDLTRAAPRLNKAWIVELLKDPQKMIPGTRMPGFWPDGVSPFPDILGGDSKAQMELLADYVLSLGQRFQTSKAVSAVPSKKEKNKRVAAAK